MVVDFNYDVTLKNVDFYKDKKNDCYLSLKYEIKNPDGSIDLMTVPAVRLPICDHVIGLSYDHDYTYTIDCGFGDLPIAKGQVKTQEGKTVKDVFFLREQIQEAPTKEMTLDEIEKQLGYKIKIINQKRR